MKLYKFSPQVVWAPHVLRDQKLRSPCGVAMRRLLPPPPAPGQPGSQAVLLSLVSILFKIKSLFSVFVSLNEKKKKEKVVVPSPGKGTPRPHRHHPGAPEAPSQPFPFSHIPSPAFHQKAHPALPCLGTPLGTPVPWRTPKLSPKRAPEGSPACTGGASSHQEGAGPGAGCLVSTQGREATRNSHVTSI